MIKTFWKIYFFVTIRNTCFSPCACLTLTLQIQLYMYNILDYTEISNQHIALVTKHNIPFDFCISCPGRSNQRTKLQDKNLNLKVKYIQTARPRVQPLM